jgi:hypothetical protein
MVGIGHIVANPRVRPGPGRSIAPAARSAPMMGA